MSPEPNYGIVSYAHKLSPLGDSTGNHNGSVEKLIDVPKLFAIIKKNWLVLKSDMMRLIPLIMFPILMVVIYGFSIGSPVKHISAALVDYDNSPLSREVASQLYSTDLFSIKYLLNSQDAGRRLIDSGEVKVLLIIPPGFSQDVQAGKTAYISTIVDESEPTIAQTTKASIQQFVQRLSQQLTASMIAGLGDKSLQISAYLSKADVALSGAMLDRTAPTLSSIDSSYRDSVYISGQTAKRLSGTIQELQNTLGFMIDQNEIAGTSPNSYSESAAALQLLATGDQQQSVLQEMASYGALAVSNAKLAKDTGAIYSGAQALSQSAAASRQSAKLAYGYVRLASQAANEVAEDSEKAQATPVALSVIEPYGSGRTAVDFLLPSILALTIFQGASMGLGRAIAGERRDGSLTRVFLTPTSNTTIIFGTQLFYLLLETVRSSLVIFVAILFFDVAIKGSILEVIAIIGIYSLGTTGIGMVMSVLTKSQDQYMALAMLVSLPTMFLSGVFFPVQTMPPIFQSIAGVIPVTYAADALRMVMIKGFPITAAMNDILALVVFGIITLTLSILLFKRELV